MLSFSLLEAIDSSVEVVDIGLMVFFVMELQLVFTHNWLQFRIAVVQGR